jgi:uncharacterized protein (TIGR02284 family)
MKASALGTNVREGDEVVTTLVRLLGLCRDGVHGYAHAARLAEDPDLRELFARLHTQREASVLELEDALWALGVRTTGSGSKLGALHAPWLEARARMGRGDGRALLEECARGDGDAIYHYRLAIESMPDCDAARIVGEQFATICGAREKVLDALGEVRGRSSSTNRAR